MAKPPVSIASAKATSRDNSFFPPFEKFVKGFYENVKAAEQEFETYKTANAINLDPNSSKNPAIVKAFTDLVNEYENLNKYLISKDNEKIERGLSHFKKCLDAYNDLVKDPTRGITQNETNVLALYQTFYNIVSVSNKAVLTRLGAMEKLYEHRNDILPEYTNIKVIEQKHNTVINDLKKKIKQEKDDTKKAQLEKDLEKEEENKKNAVEAAQKEANNYFNNILTPDGKINTAQAEKVIKQIEDPAVETKLAEYTSSHGSVSTLENDPDKDGRKWLTSSNPDPEKAIKELFDENLNPPNSWGEVLIKNANDKHSIAALRYVIHHDSIKKGSGNRSFVNLIFRGKKAKHFQTFCSLRTPSSDNSDIYSMKILLRNVLAHKEDKMREIFYKVVTEDEVLINEAIRVCRDDPTLMNGLVNLFDPLSKEFASKITDQSFCDLIAGCPALLDPKNLSHITDKKQKEAVEKQILFFSKLAKAKGHGNSAPANIFKFISELQGKDLEFLSGFTEAHLRLLDETTLQHLIENIEFCPNNIVEFIHPKDDKQTQEFLNKLTGQDEKLKLVKLDNIKYLDTVEAHNEPALLAILKKYTAAEQEAWFKRQLSEKSQTKVYLAKPDILSLDEFKIWFDGLSWENQADIMAKEFKKSEENFVNYMTTTFNYSLKHGENLDANIRDANIKTNKELRKKASKAIVNAKYKKASAATSTTDVVRNKELIHSYFNGALNNYTDITNNEEMKLFYTTILSDEQKEGFFTQLAEGLSFYYDKDLKLQSAPDPTVRAEVIRFLRVLKDDPKAIENIINILAKNEKNLCEVLKMVNLAPLDDSDPTDVATPTRLDEDFFTKLSDETLTTLINAAGQAYPPSSIESRKMVKTLVELTKHIKAEDLDKHCTIQSSFKENLKAEKFFNEMFELNPSYNTDQRVKLIESYPDAKSALKYLMSEIKAKPSLLSDVDKEKRLTPFIYYIFKKESRFGLLKSFRKNNPDAQELIDNIAVKCINERLSNKKETVFLNAALAAKNNGLLVRVFKLALVPTREEITQPANKKVKLAQIVNKMNADEVFQCLPLPGVTDEGKTLLVQKLTNIVSKEGNQEKKIELAKKLDAMLSQKEKEVAINYYLSKNPLTKMLYNKMNKPVGTLAELVERDTVPFKIKNWQQHEANNNQQAQNSTLATIKTMSAEQVFEWLESTKANVKDNEINPLIKEIVSKISKESNQESNQEKKIALAARLDEMLSPEDRKVAINYYLSKNPLTKMLYNKMNKPVDTLAELVERDTVKFKLDNWRQSQGHTGDNDDHSIELKNSSSNPLTILKILGDEEGSEQQDETNNNNPAPQPKP